MSYREGESLSIAVYAYDSEGKIQGETIHSVYGFDNVGANKIYQDVIDALQELFDLYGKEKNAKVETKTTGAIR